MLAILRRQRRSDTEPLNARSLERTGITNTKLNRSNRYIINLTFQSRNNVTPVLKMAKDGVNEVFRSRPDFHNT